MPLGWPVPAPTRRGQWWRGAALGCGNSDKHKRKKKRNQRPMTTPRTDQRA